MTVLPTADVHRRRLLQLAGLGAAAVSLGGAQVQAKASSLPTAVASGVLPERVRVAAVQSAAGADRAENLAAMLRAMERVQAQGDAKDLIVFHALALNGPLPRTLNDAQRMAIDLNGPDIRVIGAAAKTHHVYVAFAALTTDTDWPGHVIARNILMGPDGRVVLAAWQATSDSTLPFLTSVENVLDRYVGLYGPDAVLPIAQTQIGNIALGFDQATPEIYRAFALKGAEVFIRTAFTSIALWDVQASAAYNQCFSISPAGAAAAQRNADDEMPAIQGGGSVIVGPHGEVLAQAGAAWEQTLTAMLPMAYHRDVRRVPNAHAALVLPVYADQQDLI